MVYEPNVFLCCGECQRAHGPCWAQCPQTSELSTAMEFTYQQPRVLCLPPFWSELGSWSWNKQVNANGFAKRVRIVIRVKLEERNKPRSSRVQSVEAFSVGGVGWWSPDVSGLSPRALPKTSWKSLPWLHTERRWFALRKRVTTVYLGGIHVSFAI